LAACTHAPELRPPGAGPSQVIHAFIPKNGLCHFVHLDAVTGETVKSWAVQSKRCPDLVNRTIADDGSQLFAVRFLPTGGTALWQLQKGAQSLDVLSKPPSLELAWRAGGKVHAITANEPAGLMPQQPEENDPETRHEITPEELNASESVPFDELTPEERDEVTAHQPEDINEDQWRAFCYVNVLEDGVWRVLREVEIETYEGMRPPTCEELFGKWDSNARNYAGLPFGRQQKEHAFKNLPKDSWAEFEPLNVTQDGALLRRYAFTTEWFEGDMLSGRVASFAKGAWKLVKGIDGPLTEFFRSKDLIIFCSAKGFGSWNAKTAKRNWWQASSSCPFQTIPKPTPVEAKPVPSKFKSSLPRQFAGDKTCTAELWVNEKPGGLSVMLRHIQPPEEPVGSLYAATQFTIVEGRQRKVLFKNPKRYNVHTNKWAPARGPQLGWVDAQNVTVNLKFRHQVGKKPEFVLYDSPFEDGAHVIRWTPEDPEGPFRKKWRGVDEVYGCIGAWLNVRLLDANRVERSGWLHPENQCANQKTNCN
jgi:hypothetical protein